MAPSRIATLWTARILPVCLFACIGYASYVVIQRICVGIFLSTQPGVAVAFLVPFCILLAMVAASYIRVIYVIVFNPGLVPLGPRAEEQRRLASSREKRRRRPDDLESQPYEAGPDSDPDSPGLEEFYSKDVFECEEDGKPRWCSHCQAWKPDRAHHSSELNRCVRKMDHFCPWTGGIISETSFKFFVQFVFYAALYCAVALTASAYSVALSTREESVPFDANAVAVMVLAGFFGLFTFTMTLATARYIFINQTNVDVLKSRSNTQRLAIRVPRGTQPAPGYSIVTYPLPKADVGPAPDSGGSGRAARGSDGDSSSSPQGKLAADRDRLATRTFAVVAADMGDNPWDLGLYGNWVAVMGPTVFDWVLPIRESPCVGWHSNESFYPMGAVYRNLRARYRLPRPEDSEKRAERRQRQR